MRHKYLTEEQIQEAKDLRQKGMSKRKLARYFKVGSTTIWENVYARDFKRQKRFRIYTIPTQPDFTVTGTCKKCTKLMTRDTNGVTVPLNFQVLDTCITCYLRMIGHEYMDVV